MSAIRWGHHAVVVRGLPNVNDYTGLRNTTIMMALNDDDDDDDESDSCSVM
jgi:hypothetical protein